MSDTMTPTAARALVRFEISALAKNLTETRDVPIPMLVEMTLTFATAQMVRDMGKNSARRALGAMIAEIDAGTFDTLLAEKGKAH